jgi:tetratricopeptide (TPR) repeat protein
MNLGAEYGYKGFLFGRLGYRFWGVETDGLTLGLGTAVKLSGKLIKADLTWTPQGDLGNTFVLSLSMRYPGRLTEDQRKLADILYYRGIYFYTQGEYDRAVEMWKECLKLDPENELAKKKINEAYRMNELRKTEEEVERKLKDRNPSPE